MCSRNDCQPGFSRLFFLDESQRGYGVVSFGKAHLDWVLDYIKHQREHHAHGRLEARLEMWEASQEAAFEKPG